MLVERPSYEAFRDIVAIHFSTMQDSIIATIIGIVGTLLGTCLGYRLSIRASEKHFRRTVLRDIAFEYRRLAHSMEAGGVQGLILAGIYQCADDKEYEYVLKLVEDLKPKFESGDNWRPKNGKYVEFFTRLRNEGIDPTNSQQLMELKKRVENT